MTTPVLAPSSGGQKGSKPTPASVQLIFSAMDSVATLSSEALRASVASLSDDVLRSLLLRGLTMQHTRPTESLVSRVNSAASLQRQSVSAGAAGGVGDVVMQSGEADTESHVTLNSDLKPLGKNLWCAILRFLPLYERDFELPAVSRSFFKLVNHFPAAWHSFNPESPKKPRRPLGKDTLRLVRVATLDHNSLEDYGRNLKGLWDLTLTANCNVSAPPPTFAQLLRLHVVRNDAALRPPLWVLGDLAASRLTRLEVSRAVVGREDIHVISRLSELETLTFRSCTFDGHHADLSPLGICKRLQALAFEGHPTQPARRLTLPAASSVKTLSLTNQHSPKQLPEIQLRLSDYPGLTSLTLHRCGPLPDCFQRRDFPAQLLRGLQRLSCFDFPLDTLRALPVSLTDLEVYEVETTVQLGALCGRILKACPGLKRLSFVHLAQPLVRPEAPVSQHKKLGPSGFADAGAGTRQCWFVDITASLHKTEQGRRRRQLFLSQEAAEVFAKGVQREPGSKFWRDFAVGDIIDAKDTQGNWYQSEVRLIKDDRMQVHFIGWPSQWDEWISVNSEDRLAPKCTHCQKPFESHGAGGVADPPPPPPPQQQQQQQQQGQQKPRELVFTAVQGYLQCPEPLELLRAGCCLIGDWVDPQQEKA